MATIVREIQIAASAERVWDAVRDVGAVHRRLVPGLVVDVILEPALRHVTFANGLVLDEVIVSVDDSIRRVAYTALNRAKHHQASMQVFPEDKDRCRFVWITDVLPNEIAAKFAAVMDQAIPIIERTLVTPTEPNSESSALRLP
jgi:Polyketide cyclase / dehydrase and lipid transport